MHAVGGVDRCTQVGPWRHGQTYGVGRQHYRTLPFMGGKVRATEGQKVL